MKYGIASLGEAVDRHRVADIALTRTDTAGPLPYIVIGMPRDEHHIVSASHELGHCARSHDSGPTCNEYFHESPKGR